ncbi:MAG: HU family DNA-binding protein [Lentisphaerae bacterium]|nr:HU family DNA-binding protein [Lentisphaerota bacterium]
MKTKSEIIAELAETAGVEKAQAATMLEALVAMAIREAADGFTIPGLGKLVKVERAARMGRNPATGETIQIAAKSALKFRLAKAAKEAIMTPA